MNQDTINIIVSFLNIIESHRVARVNIFFQNAWKLVHKPKNKFDYVNFGYTAIKTKDNSAFKWIFGKNKNWCTYSLAMVAIMNDNMYALKHLQEDTKNNILRAIKNAIKHNKTLSCDLVIHATTLIEEGSLESHTQYNNCVKLLFKENKIEQIKKLQAHICVDTIHYVLASCSYEAQCYVQLHTKIWQCNYCNMLCNNLSEKIINYIKEYGYYNAVAYQKYDCIKIAKFFISSYNIDTAVGFQIISAIINKNTNILKWLFDKYICIIKKNTVPLILGIVIAFFHNHEVLHILYEFINNFKIHNVIKPARVKIIEFLKKKVSVPTNVITFHWDTIKEIMEFKSDSNAVEFISNNRCCFQETIFLWLYKQKTITHIPNTTIINTLRNTENDEYFELIKHAHFNDEDARNALEGVVEVCPLTNNYETILWLLENGVQIEIDKTVCCLKYYPKIKTYAKSNRDNVITRVKKTINFILQLVKNGIFGKNKVQEENFKASSEIIKILTFYCANKFYDVQFLNLYNYYVTECVKINKTTFCILKKIEIRWYGPKIMSLLTTSWDNLHQKLFFKNNTEVSFSSTMNVGWT